MKKLNKFLGLLLLLAMGLTSIETLPVHAEGESAPKEGFSFTENTTHPEWDADYLATFVYRNTDESKTVKSVSLAGGFQFYNPAEVHDYKGFADNSFIPCYDAFQYRKGMHPASGSTQKDVSKDGQIRYPMTEVEENVYEVTLPLPANQYYYAYYVTYEGTDEEVKINDPANLPVKAPSGSDAGWSLALVGDSAHAPEGQQYIYPDAVNKGTVKNVQYTAADGTTQWLEVYLPYGYSMDTKYKTVYVSHGGGGNEDEWMTIGSMKNMMDNMIEQGVTEPAIVVTMNNSVIKDWDLRTKNIAENIVPFVEAYFSSSPKAEDRAFCGLSMGGRVTSEVMKAHPDMFRYFGMFSGGIPDDDINNYNVEEMKKDTFYLTAGNVDMAYSNGGGWDIEKLAGMLDSFGVKYTLDRPYGGHDWYVWRASYTKFATDYLWKNSSEKDYKAGISVSDTKNENGTYNVTFTYKTDKEISAVAVAGNMQFYKKEQLKGYISQTVDDQPMNGDEYTIDGYDAYHYEDGMFTTGYLLDSAKNGRTTNGGLEYPLERVANGTYQVTLPLPAGMYYYDYILTDSEGNKNAVIDPANVPLTNPLNGDNCNHSLFWVGTADEGLPNDTYSFARTDGKTGTTEFVSYPSYDGSEQTLGIYLPYGYTSEKTYKVLYLSHGGGGNESEWFNIGAAQNIFDNAIANGEVEPTIVVTMNNSYYSFYNGDSVKNIVNNVIPYVESHYSVVKDRSGRAMAGLSAGGGTTVATLLEENDVFDYYGVWSPSVMPFDSSTTDDEKVSEDLKDAAKYYISVGSFDMFIRRDNDKMFYDELTKIGANTAFDYKNGAHDWSVWRAQLTTFATDYLWKNSSAKEYKPGVAVSENKNPAYSAPYQVEFTMDSNSLDEKVTNVQLVGNFQFLKEEEAHLYKEQGGKNDNMTWYSAYEYQNGMFPTGACGNTDREDLNYYRNLITYDMKNDGGVYTVTLPLPATEYYYGYLLTYEDGSQKTVWDPANAPVVNEANGHDPTWSYVFVGDSKTALKEQEAIYSCEKAGTWSFVTYPASDGTEQPLGVYLPYGYDSSRKYKTLYLSHGGGGNETEWFQLGAAANIFDNLTAEGKVEPTVIVTMDNSHWKGGITAESNETVAHELADYIIPFMEKNYNVSDKASDRAYAGLSAGGVATAVVLQYRPEVVDYYGIISACAIRKEIPSNIMDAMKKKHIFVGAGNVDFGLTGTPLSTDTILKFFDENKISYDFRTFNGSHDWNTWRAALTTFAEDYLWKYEKVDDGKTDTKPVVKPNDSKKDNTTQTPQKTDKKAAAKTGDTSNSLIYVGTFFVGLIAAAWIYVLKRRHS